MKYTSTARLANLIIFGTIFAGFGCLACFFAFWVTPCYLAGSAEYAQLFNGTYSYNWAVNFSMIGVAIFALSIVGLVYSIKAMRENSTDADVVKCFLIYVVMGNVMALWCLLNAAVWYNMVSNGTSTSFWIILFVVLFLGFLLGANIPMSKLLDNDDGSAIQGIFSSSVAALAFGYLFSTVISLIVMLGASDNVGRFALKLGTYDGLALVAFIACLFSALLAFKKKCGKLPVGLFGLALAAIGTIFIVDASFEYAYRNDSKVFSFMTVYGTSYAGLDYVCMAYIVGILIALLAVALIIVSIIPEKKKAISKKA